MDEHLKKALDFCTRTGTKITFESTPGGSSYYVAIERKGMKYVIESYDYYFKPTEYHILRHLVKYSPYEERVDKIIDCLHMTLKEAKERIESILNSYEVVMYLFGDVIDELREIE